ncbi:UDP-N-acetylmuramate:L-alanyl-gamma-D-glutamyl-meso-diaminopimelate ligase [Thermodesulfobacteriota bacterium]
MVNQKKNTGVISSDLSQKLNSSPADFHHVHLMGICGTGMASLAGILKQRGYRVTGSDENIYPPMSLFLQDLSIPILKGYRAENLNPTPDLVIVGNVITRFNPEAVELARLCIPYLSLPQALKQFAIEGKKSIVISGTHGKTTTSTMASWVLEEAGMDPSFMIGGIPVNFQGSFKLGKGTYFIIEGDEYDTAFFDKGPKFLHYAPWAVVLTSIEFDHADIFRDLNHVVESFRKLIGLIPLSGILIANGDDPVVLAESKRSKCDVITYGLSNNNLWRAVDISTEGGLTRFKALKGDMEYISITTPIYGQHNISNLLSAIALSNFLNIEQSALSSAAFSFQGVKRRQEIRGEKAGILVLDDFAHHPTAVEKTIKAVKNRYKERRLIAVFEPRSNSSRRDIFQERYASSFDKADLVFIPEPPMMGKIPPKERFSSRKLVESLIKREVTATYSTDTGQLLREILDKVRPGDVVLIMSNGSFDNLHDRLLDSL